MPARHWLIGTVIFAVLVGPVLAPAIYNLLAYFSGRFDLFLGRWSVLFGQSLALVCGVWICCGFLSAWISLSLVRTDAWAGRIWLLALGSSLVVPLPIFATAWLALARGSSWATGLVPAIAIHSLAGLPWVVWILAIALVRVEPEVEEDARTACGTGLLLRRVILVRAISGAVVAALWLAIMCLSEISVTDLCQVRTFAEEVYTQTVLPDPGGPADAMPQRAVVAALPSIVFIAGLAAFAALRLGRGFPGLLTPIAIRYRFDLGVWRPLVSTGIAIVCMSYLLVPLASLAWRLGAVSNDQEWSLPAALGYLNRALLSHGGTLIQSLLTACTVAVFLIPIALWCCVQAKRSAIVGGILVAVCAIVVAMPAPAVGVMLKQSIGWLIDFEDRIGTTLISQLLYSGSSTLPAAWACAIRAFPFAVAILWPAVRSIPDESWDLGMIDGAAVYRKVAWPMTRDARRVCFAAIAILVLGEVGASKIVATAGGQLFTHDIFARMHYGPGNTLAAMCWMLLAAIGIPFGFVWIVNRIARSSVSSQSIA